MASRVQLLSLSIMLSQVIHVVMDVSTSFLFVLCSLAHDCELCPTLFDPADCSPPGSCVHGLFQARILEQVSMPSYKGSSRPRDQTHVSYVSCIGRWVLYH